MSALAHNGKYGVINTSDSIIMVYYVVKFLSEPYMLQDDKKVDKQFRKEGEIIAKSGYLCIMKYNTNWYCQQLGTKESVII